MNGMTKMNRHDKGPLEDKTYTLIIKSEFAYGPTITHQFNYSSTLDESFVVTEKE